MTTRPFSPRGPASAPMHNPGSKQTANPNYDVIARLRAVREEGDDAMTAAERYDPDFSIKLASCMEEAEADKMLDAWLARRSDVLKRTQAHLRQVWTAAHGKSSADCHSP